MFKSQHIQNEAKTLKKGMPKLPQVQQNNRHCDCERCGSQFDIPDWHELLYDPTLADAICDRIVYNSHVLTIKCESMRRMNAISE